MSHQRTRAILLRELPHEGANAAVDLFATELDRYAEIVIDQDDETHGFMTRGEGSSFADRVTRLLADLGLPESARAHHRALDGWFGHRRAFVKVEWRRDGDGADVSIYFRRRPIVGRVADLLRETGVAAPLLDHLREVARLLHKSTVHFVAAAFSRDRPVQHKLYFSQYAAPAERAQKAEHVARLLGLYEMSDAARDRFRQAHDCSLPEGSPTFFVSIGFGAAELAPTVKLDYPEVAPAHARAWLDERDAEAAAPVAERLCAGAGLRALSYMGVRFTAGEDRVRLKYYADLPRDR